LNGAVAFQCARLSDHLLEADTFVTRQIRWIGSFIWPPNTPSKTISSNLYRLAFGGYVGQYTVDTLCKVVQSDVLQACTCGLLSWQQGILESGIVHFYRMKNFWTDGGFHELPGKLEWRCALQSCRTMHAAQAHTCSNGSSMHVCVHANMQRWSERCLINLIPH